LGGSKTDIDIETALRVGELHAGEQQNKQWKVTANAFHVEILL